MATFVYDHEEATSAIHDVLYDIVPDGIENLNELLVKFDPEEDMIGDLQETEPVAYQVYENIGGLIMDRLEECNIIPSTRGENNFCERYPTESDLFFDELDEQIEFMVVNYRQHCAS